ncbi:MULTISPECIES: hypothetical protein [unclassified Microcoleus]
MLVVAIDTVIQLTEDYRLRSAFQGRAGSVRATIKFIFGGVGF